MNESMKEYDLVIFGATGFTGKRVVEYARDHCKHLKVAVAGRNEDRLRDVVVQHGDGMAVLAGVDVTAPESLRRMADAAKLVLSCVGPYRSYGEAVVAACVAAKADYMDVCGEPEFMEAMQLKYGEAAKAAGVFIISSVGFDCIPAEVGAACCLRALEAKGVQPHSIQSYLHLTYGPSGSAGHFATFESAVYGFSSADNLKRLRRKAASKQLNPAPKISGPRPGRPASSPTWQPRYKGWALPFPGADASVVRRTMSARAAAGRPVAHYVASLIVKSRANLALFLVLGFVFALLARFGWGVRLLLRFPRLFTGGMFSHAGPSAAQLRESGFNMVLEAYGLRDGASEPTLEATIQVKGPEAGYVATPLVMVQAALEFLEARARIAEVLGGGGVVTPGAALLLHGETYIQRLKAAGLAIGDL